MPITTPAENVATYGGDIKHFEHVLDHLFTPALTEAGYDVVRPSVENSEIIQAEIIRNIETADLVLCDISTWNANVFFELGIRVALDRPVALVRDSVTSGLPFDTAMISCHSYDMEIAPWKLPDEVRRLAGFVRSAGQQERNALWRHFGITQRSLPTNATPSSLEEKVDLVLSYLTTEPSPSVVPDPVSLPEQTLVEDDVALRIIRDAAEIAREYGARISVQSVAKSIIVFDLGNYMLGTIGEERIRALGGGTRYTIRLMGKYIGR